MLFVEIYKNIFLMTRRLKPRKSQTFVRLRETEEYMGYLRRIVFINIFKLQSEKYPCQLFFGLVRHQVMPVAKRAIAKLKANENRKGCNCIKTGIL